jgi:hypothetical protein
LSVEKYSKYLGIHLVVPFPTIPSY